MSLTTVDLPGAPSPFEADGLAAAFGLNYFCHRARNPPMSSECVYFWRAYR